ncbi:thioredoxin family protein [uncultured Weeksella sp.]|uniref:TlpA family protein disulfide reductase n=1 Tax=uncultured Weeksella sp. TaxID=1161389 RepID=UPI00259BCE04|nr:thioredoxin family protein [uncultured Weeksella sp.]
MNKLISFYFFMLFIWSGIVFGQKIPQTDKKIFTEDVLHQTVKNRALDDVSLQSILQEQRGEVVVLYFWASWCKDCLVGFPKLKTLQQKNPKVKFIFFSLDKTQKAWDKAIDKYALQGDHYWFSSGWENPFNNYIDLNWVPRYLLLNREGNIAKYYTIQADDQELQQAINQL